jgi:hypothetical protein
MKMLSDNVMGYLRSRAPEALDFWTVKAPAPGPMRWRPCDTLYSLNLIGRMDILAPMRESVSPILLKDYSLAGGIGKGSGPNWACTRPPMHWGAHILADSGQPVQEQCCGKTIGKDKLLDEAHRRAGPGIFTSCLAGGALDRRHSRHCAVRCGAGAGVGQPERTSRSQRCSAFQRYPDRSPHRIVPHLQVEASQWDSARSTGCATIPMSATWAVSRICIGPIMRRAGCLTRRRRPVRRAWTLLDRRPFMETVPYCLDFDIVQLARTPFRKAIHRQRAHARPLCDYADDIITFYETGLDGDYTLHKLPGGLATLHECALRWSWTKCRAGNRACRYRAPSLLDLKGAPP